MKVISVKLPISSILNQPNRTYDYIDSFQAAISDENNKIKPEDVGKAFFTSGPKWIDQLFTFRNKIVSAFGLKTPGEIKNRQEMLEKFKCEKGERLGLFKVFDKNNQEVILGEDDKHLNFRVSLFLDSSLWTNQNPTKHLTISTTVEFNNLFGKLYFLPVRPFHTLIVPSMLKGIVAELEKK